MGFGMVICDGDLDLDLLERGWGCFIFVSLLDTGT